ncbi:hypothetical protein [Streptomyces sp. SD15]
MLVAAGIGITPLLSMAHQLRRAGGRFRLHYFAGSRETATFVRLLESAEFAADVEFHFGVDRGEQPEAPATAPADADPAGGEFSYGREFPRPVVRISLLEIHFRSTVVHARTESTFHAGRRR